MTKFDELVTAITAYETERAGWWDSLRSENTELRALLEALRVDVEALKAAGVPDPVPVPIETRTLILDIKPSTTPAPLTFAQSEALPVINRAYIHAGDQSSTDGDRSGLILTPHTGGDWYDMYLENPGNPISKQGGLRTEWAMFPERLMETVYDYEWEDEFPAMITPDGGYLIMVQWHGGNNPPAPQANGPVLAYGMHNIFGAGRRGFYQKRTTGDTPLWSEPIPLGTPTQWRVRVRWSTDPDRAVTEIYKDGVRLALVNDFRFPGFGNLTRAEAPYPKTGFYGHPGAAARRLLKNFRVLRVEPAAAA